jgi:hypothetical protein
VVADAVRIEPVSESARAEMGKIVGKSRESPRAERKNAENPCATGTFDDSEVKK